MGGPFSLSVLGILKTLGLSLNEAVLAFCIFAFSVIRFSLQLVPLSPVLVWNVGVALDICTSSPRCSLGVSVLCSLKRLGMPIGVPDLPSTSMATMYRTAKASGVLDRLFDEVCAMVRFHNFKSLNFKLSVSNPKTKYVAYVSVLSEISNCQGLGCKSKHDNLKTDRTRGSDRAVFCPRHRSWMMESAIFNLVKVRGELSSVPGIGTLSGRKVQWGALKI